MPELRGNKTEFRDETESYFDVLDPDDPTLMDRYPTYDTYIDLGDWPPTLTQQMAGVFQATSQ